MTKVYIAPDGSLELWTRYRLPGTLFNPKVDRGWRVDREYIDESLFGLTDVLQRNYLFDYVWGGYQDPSFWGRLPVSDDPELSNL